MCCVSVTSNGARAQASSAISKASLLRAQHTHTHRYLGPMSLANHSQILCDTDIAPPARREKNEILLGSDVSLRVSTSGRAQLDTHRHVIVWRYKNESEQSHLPLRAQRPSICQPPLRLNLMMQSRPGKALIKLYYFQMALKPFWWCFAVECRLFSGRSINTLFETVC